MSAKNVEVVRDQFDAVNERDFPRAMSHYAEDVVLVAHSGAFLTGGTFEGRDAVGKWFGDWFSTFAHGYRFEIYEARDLGDRVLIAATHHARGRGSGVELRSDGGWVYTVRDGKVARVEIYRDRASALEAAGLA